MQLTTQQLIIMQYGFCPLIPLADVAKDYLAPSSDCELRRQARQGKLPFAVVINGKGKATTYHVPVESLAAWVDKQKTLAINDHMAMQS